MCNGVGEIRATTDLNDKIDNKGKVDLALNYGDLGKTIGINEIFLDEASCHYDDTLDFNYECFEYDNICYYIMDYSFDRSGRDCFWTTGLHSIAMLLPSTRHFLKKLITKYRISYNDDLSTIYNKGIAIRLGLQRIRTDNPYLNYLYRFMWIDPQYKRIVYDYSLVQYGRKSVTPLYKQSDNVNVSFDYLRSQIRESSRSDYEYEFSYDSSVSFHFLPSGRHAFIENRDNPGTNTALNICMSVINKTKERSIKLKITPKTTFMYSNVSLIKSCNGLYFVHIFHPCSRSTIFTQEDVTSDLALFRCDNGWFVHYTVTCDGYDHCYDNSDEKQCHLNLEAFQGKSVG